MKRTLLARAAAMLAVIALAVAPAAAIAATSEPIAVSGSASACPTTWHEDYGQKYFYSSSSSSSKRTMPKLVKDGVGFKGLCIDVSEHNGKIEWKKVKKAGMDYAIIRCGYGQDYSSQDDDQWARNALYAPKYGVKIGVYLYSYAYNETMAYGEAQHVLRCLREAGLEPDDLDLPVYYDLEEASVRPSNQMLARMAAVFCNTIAAEGYDVGIYASTSWFMSYLTDDVFDDYGWSKWVAQYYSQCTYCRKPDTSMDTMANYGEYLDMWQFTSRGWITGANNGINRVDTNMLFNDEFSSAGVKAPIPGGTICYELNGGTNAEANASEYPKGGVLELANPTRKYYSFKGWYANGVKVTSVSKADYPAVTLTAKWAKNTFNIAYELDGGTNNADNPASAWTKNGTTLKDPTRSGYTFEGWYTTPDFQEGTQVTSVKASKGKTVTVYAKWKQEETYTISYKLNGGTNNAANPSKVLPSQSTELAAPTRKGCTFLGWYTTKGFVEDSLVTAVQGAAGQKITVYAKWKVKSYKLTYVLEKGNMPSGAPSKYQVTSETFDLPLPTRKGYGFAGWYTSSACTGTPLFAIEKGSTGTKKLYGAWVKGAYNAKVTASSLNVRKSASTSAAVVGALKSGQTVCITKLNSAKTWGYVNGSGWVKLSYTKKL
ncbi:MAG: InlB B-repeat-containing protein [Coriobacteriales bacterium]